MRVLAPEEGRRRVGEPVHTLFCKQLKEIKRSSLSTRTPMRVPLSTRVGAPRAGDASNCVSNRGRRVIKNSVYHLTTWFRHATRFPIHPNTQNHTNIHRVRGRGVERDVWLGPADKYSHKTQQLEARGTLVPPGEKEETSNSELRASAHVPSTTTKINTNMNQDKYTRTYGAQRLCAMRRTSA